MPGWDRRRMLLVVAGAAALSCAEPAGPDIAKSTLRDRIVFISDRSGYDQLFSVRPDGSGLMPLSEPRTYINSPSISPDGEWVVFGLGGDLFLIAAAGGRPVRLTSTLTRFEMSPAWSPDGSQIAYVAGVNESFDIFVMDADGSNDRRLTNHVETDQGPLSWSPDGAWLFFESWRDGGARIYTLKIADTTAYLFGNGVCPESDASWSHDGQWIAFLRDTIPCQHPRIHVMRPDGTDQRHLRTGDLRPGRVAWSPDDRWLVFTTYSDDGDSDIWVMHVASGTIHSLVVRPGRDHSPAWGPGPSAGAGAP